MRFRYVVVADVAEVAVRSVDNRAARNAVIAFGGPEALTQREALAIFEDAFAKRCTVTEVPEEALEAQWAAAPDPFSRSFAALMLGVATRRRRIADTFSLTMRVTVCELHDEPDAFAADWSALCAHVGRERSDLVLLPEMLFGRWFAVTRPFDERRWSEAIDAHHRWAPRITELGASAVIHTRPTERSERRLNEAVVVTAEGPRAVHDKRYLPDEEGYWEASWYEAGDSAFEPFVLVGATLGAAICTEMWMLDVSRQYGLRGADIIAVPRVPASSRERWLVGGAFCMSSNRSGVSTAGDAFAGQGWIIDPEGDVLAVTSDAEPFTTRDIDLARSAEAKTTYPRYVW